MQGYLEWFLGKYLDTHTAASPIFGSRDSDCWIHGGRCVRCNRKATAAQRAHDYESVFNLLFQGTAPTATGASRWNASIVVRAVRELPTNGHPNLRNKTAALASDLRRAHLTREYGYSTPVRHLYIASTVPYPWYLLEV